MTKPVCVFHHREWAEQDWESKIKNRLNGIDPSLIYNNKFKFLQVYLFGEKMKIWSGSLLCLPLIKNLLVKILGLNTRDWLNLTKGRFINLFDPLINTKNPYHNIQHIHPSILQQDQNPYRHLLQENL